MTSTEDLFAQLSAETAAEYLSGEGIEPDGVGACPGARAEGDLGYGIDLHCVTDCDANMSEVDPMSPEAVGEWVSRCLQTPTGGLLLDPVLVQALGEDQAYGFDLSSMLSVDYTDKDLLAMADLAAAAVLRDDRIASCVVGLEETAPGVVRCDVRGETKQGLAYSSVLVLTPGVDPSA